ncbi:MAG: D-alanine--D-alanine ligase family protein, partial [Bacillota bacterium]
EARRRWSWGLGGDPKSRAGRQKTGSTATGFVLPKTIEPDIFHQRAPSKMRGMTMGFVVGLAYNLKKDCPRSEMVVEDADAEFEEQATVDRIVKALRAAGHRVVRMPYGPGLLSRLQRDHVDIVFNIAEGWDGRCREAIVPAILESLGVPYTGSDPLTLAVCLDKAVTKAIVSSYGVPTPRSVKVETADELHKVDLDFPLFVKPAYEGSSKGVRSSSKVIDREELARMVSWITGSYRQPALVEEFLPGREFTVGILGNNDLETLPIMEVRPVADIAPESFVYCYNTKHDNMERFLCPAPVSDDLAEKIRDVAVRAYRVLECRDLARVDVRLDRAGNPNFLEINPLPGLSTASLYPIAAMAAGLSFEDLVLRILEVAASRVNLAARKRAQDAVARRSRSALART